MWTAIILFCTNLEFTDCKAEANPHLAPNEDKCNYMLALGIEMFEYSGLYVKDYKCLQWPTGV